MPPLVAAPQRRRAAPVRFIPSTTPGQPHVVHISRAHLEAATKLPQQQQQLLLQQQQQQQQGSPSLPSPTAAKSGGAITIGRLVILGCVILLLLLWEYMLPHYVPIQFVIPALYLAHTVRRWATVPSAMSSIFLLEHLTWSVVALLLLSSGWLCCLANLGLLAASLEWARVGQFKTLFASAVALVFLMPSSGASRSEAFALQDWLAAHSVGFAGTLVFNANGVGRRVRWGAFGYVAKVLTPVRDQLMWHLCRHQHVYMLVLWAVVVVVDACLETALGAAVVLVTLFVLVSGFMMRWATIVLGGDASLPPGLPPPRTQMSFLTTIATLNTFVYLVVPLRLVPMVANATISAYVVLHSFIESEALHPGRQDPAPTHQLYLQFLLLVALDVGIRCTATGGLPAMPQPFWAVVATNATGYGALMMSCCWVDIRYHSVARAAVPGPVCAAGAAAAAVIAVAAEGSPSPPAADTSTRRSRATGSSCCPSPAGGAQPGPTLRITARYSAAGIWQHHRDAAVVSACSALTHAAVVAAVTAAAAAAAAASAAVWGATMQPHAARMPSPPAARQQIARKGEAEEDEREVIDIDDDDEWAQPSTDVSTEQLSVGAEEDTPATAPADAPSASSSPGPAGEEAPQQNAPAEGPQQQQAPLQGKTAAKGPGGGRKARARLRQQQEQQAQAARERREMRQAVSHLSSHVLPHPQGPTQQPRAGAGSARARRAATAAAAAAAATVAAAAAARALRRRKQAVKQGAGAVAKQLPDSDAGQGQWQKVNRSAAALRARPPAPASRGEGQPAAQPQRAPAPAQPPSSAQRPKPPQPAAPLPRERPQPAVVPAPRRVGAADGDGARPTSLPTAQPAAPESPRSKGKPRKQASGCKHQEQPLPLALPLQQEQQPQLAQLDRVPSPDPSPATPDWGIKGLGEFDSAAAGLAELFAGCGPFGLFGTRQQEPVADSCHSPSDGGCAAGAEPDTFALEAEETVARLCGASEPDEEGADEVGFPDQMQQRHPITAAAAQSYTRPNVHAKPFYPNGPSRLAHNDATPADAAGEGSVGYEHPVAFVPTSNARNLPQQHQQQQQRGAGAKQLKAPCDPQPAQAPQVAQCFEPQGSLVPPQVQRAPVQQQQQQQGQGLPDAQPQLVAVDPQFYGGGPFVNCSQPQTVMVPVDPALAAAGAQPQSAQPQGTVLVPVLFSAAPQLMPTVFMAPTMQQPLPYVLSAPQVSFEPGST
eukprot:TRINITY_DN3140_c1_g1_i18.p1 TRINITY_DN3140_c1_g1~~TRINITY_DN3140_c1_g1_i18.p1  ORF type:complete len:1266 (+),score=299.41 TRINITY_DN3140_c1_g1_i18:135-3800(+)